MITLVPHNPNWITDFNVEKENLENILGDIIIAIEHIGSTAIPGIHAKPVIDILIGVKDLKQFSEEHIKKIQSLGYEYIKLYEEKLPYRRFFRKDNASSKRTHHIHLVNYHSAWWQRHILFRNYLKKHADSAKAYEDLKLKLAESLNTDKIFFNKQIQSNSQLAKEYQSMQNTFGEDFTIGNQYALAKSLFVESISKKAYFDFSINRPDVILNKLNGYIPQPSCFEFYKNMFQDPKFIRCYGVSFDDARIEKILEKNTASWDQHQLAPYAWFDKTKSAFVGQGGLNHTHIDGQDEIELTYALCKEYWGKGLAAEIGQFAINYAFNTLGLDNIVCFTMTTNQQSLRVIEKLGFTYKKDFMHHQLPHKLFRMNKAMFHHRGHREHREF